MDSLRRDVEAIEQLGSPNELSWRRLLASAQEVVTEGWQKVEGGRRHRGVADA
jgi:hypothetical protein